MHMAKLMPLPLTISCYSKSRLVLPFWYQLTQVVSDKGPLNGCCWLPLNKWPLTGVCMWLGDMTHLLAYESDRQRRVVPMMGGIDCLNRLYGNRFTPVVLLRNIGCHLTHSLKPVKVQDLAYFIIFYHILSFSLCSLLRGRYT